MNNYTCNCHAGFTGRNCDIMIVNCTIDSCYPNVTCYENNNSIICGPCPPELTGDGKICKGILVKPIPLDDLFRANRVFTPFDIASSITSLLPLHDMRFSARRKISDESGRDLSRV